MPRLYIQTATFPVVDVLVAFELAFMLSKAVLVQMWLPRIV